MIAELFLGLVTRASGSNFIENRDGLPPQSLKPMFGFVWIYKWTHMDPQQR